MEVVYFISVVWSYSSSESFLCIMFFARTVFKISQGVNAFDYNEKLNLIGTCLNIAWCFCCHAHVNALTYSESSFSHSWSESSCLTMESLRHFKASRSASWPHAKCCGCQIYRITWTDY